jgi:hypothetical protein
MSKLHPARRKRASCAESALSELCIRLGYCIDPESEDAILANAPADADTFVDAVLVAEGRDPSLVLKEERRVLLQVVTDWVYDEEGGRGTASGLPRFPGD